MSFRLDFTAPAGAAISMALNLLLSALLAAVILGAGWAANRDASHQARERVVFELTQLREEYGRLATDYAWWDEAFERLTGQRDVAWVNENIAGWLGRTVSLSAAYAFDGAGRALYSSASVLPSAEQVGNLLAAARAQPVSSPKAATAFVEVGDRPMLMAAAVLRPMNPVAGGRYADVLVFAWEVETVVLERLRASSRVPGLTISWEEAEGLELHDSQGRALLRLGWQPARPGSRFIAQVLPAAGAVLAILSVVGWRYWLRGRRHFQALAAAEDSRLRLLAAISHDLRQPLQSMALFSAALEQEVHSVRGDRAVAFLRNSVARMDELLSAILKLARLDMRPNGTLPLVAVPLEAVLRGLHEELEPQAAAKGLRLRRVPTSLTVRSDPVMLAALLRNLVSNAIRYTPGGKVLVGVRRRRGGVEICVGDTGIGIADHQQRLIFEEFFQVGNPARDPALGLGLGLSIVQRLARLLECRVGVHSVRGKGSCFSVAVPLFVADAV